MLLRDAGTYNPWWPRTARGLGAPASNPAKWCLCDSVMPEMIGYRARARAIRRSLTDAYTGYPADLALRAPPLFLGLENPAPDLLTSQPYDRSI